jgi:competence protein ComEA
MSTNNQKQPDTWLDRNRNWLLITLTVVCLAGVAVFYLRQPTQEPIEIIPAATLIPTVPGTTPSPSQLRVYITGAIAHPDVYLLPPGSIVKDLVQVAGGLTAEANEAGFNQALELTDQQHIHVPNIGEVSPPVKSDPNQAQPGQPAEKLINLNTASLAELETLPGIGPTLAQRILDYRENIGGFTSIEQLKEVSGIGEATFEEIAPLATLQ